MGIQIIRWVVFVCLLYGGCIIYLYQTNFIIVFIVIYLCIFSPVRGHKSRTFFKIPFWMFPEFSLYWRPLSTVQGQRGIGNSVN